MTSFVIILAIVVLNVAAIASLLVPAIKTRKWAPVIGTVEKIRVEPFGDGDINIPEISYKLDDQIFFSKYRGPSGPDIYRDGEKLALRVNPKNPNEFYMWRWSSILFPLAIICLIDLLLLFRVV